MFIDLQIYELGNVTGELGMSVCKVMSTKV